MQFNKIISLFLCVSIFTNLCAKDESQIIQVINNSPQVLELSNIEGKFKFTHLIPSFAKLLISLEYLKKLTPQDMLFNAIINDSPVDIVKAINGGADIKIEKEGKSLLFWALLLKKPEAIKCLIDYGAL